MEGQNATVVGQRRPRGRHPEAFGAPLTDATSQTSSKPSVTGSSQPRLTLALAVCASLSPCSHAGYSPVVTPR